MRVHNHGIIALLCALNICLLSASRLALADAQVTCTSDALPSAHTEVIFPHENKKQTRVWLGWPQTPGHYPLILFSHGAFSAPERYLAILQPLVAAGYIVAAPLHQDSELLNNPTLSRADTWELRLRDIQALLSDKNHLLQQNLPDDVLIDEQAIALAGHSYGGIVAQVFAGARTDALSHKLADDVRIKAVLTWSPPGAMSPTIPKDSWQTMDTPSLVITGSKDVLPGFIDNWQRHLDAWYSAPAGDNWAFIGDGVDHYFGYHICRLEPPTTDSQIDASQLPKLKASVTVARQFLDTYVKQDAKAKTCLNTARVSTLTDDGYSVERR